MKCLEDVLLQHIFVQRLGLLNKQSYSINRLCSIFNLRLEKWDFVRLGKGRNFGLKKKSATLRPYRLDWCHCRNTCNVNWTRHDGHGQLGLLTEPDYSKSWAVSKYWVRWTQERCPTNYKSNLIMVFDLPRKGSKKQTSV